MLLEKPRLKMLIMAWDGATPQVVFPNLELFPTLQKICREGASGSVRSRTNSYDVWMTYYTGLMPEKHGLQMRKMREVRQILEGPEELRFLRRVKCKKFLWDYVNAAGFSIGMFGALGTFPAPSVNGFVISGELLFGWREEAFSPLALKSFYQEGLFNYSDPPTLRELGVTCPFAALATSQLEHILWSSPYFISALPAMAEKIRKYHLTLNKIISIYPVDVLFVYFIDLDIVQHFSFYEPDRKTIIQAYRMLDESLGSLIKEYRPENVLVISDHGLECYAKVIGGKVEGEQLSGSLKRLSDGTLVGEAGNGGIVSGMHINSGFYIAAGPGIQPGRSLNINFINVLPMIAGILGIALPAGLDGKKPEIFNAK